MDRVALRVEPCFADLHLAEAVVSGWLTVQVVTVLQRDLSLVSDDFVISATLQKEDVLQWDACEPFRLGARLDRALKLGLRLLMKT